MRVLWSRKLELSTIGLMLLALLASAPRAAAETGRSSREELMQLADEYRQVFATYPQETTYGRALEQLISQLGQLTPEEAAASEPILGMLTAHARENLEIYKRLLEYRRAAAQQRAVSTGFPEADFSTIDIPWVWEVVADELPKLDNLWDWVLSFDNGVIPEIPDVPFIPESAIPLYCPGDLDGDGLPDREPVLFRMLLDLALRRTESVRDVAGRICDQDLGITAVAVAGGGLSGNLSIVCIAFDVVYYVEKFFLDNIMVCESYYDGLELEASYLRLGHIHEDMETHESHLADHALSIQQDLATHESNLGTHDSEVRDGLSAIQGVQGQHGLMLENILSTQQQIIELLNTPQGRREGWNDK